MKALFFIPLVFGIFITFLGITTRKVNGDPLSNALVAGGTLIISAVVIIWTIIYFKEKKDKSGR